MPVYPNSYLKLIVGFISNPTLFLAKGDWHCSKGPVIFFNPVISSHPRQQKLIFHLFERNKTCITVKSHQVLFKILYCIIRSSSSSTWCQCCRAANVIIAKDPDSCCKHLKLQVISAILSWFYKRFEVSYESSPCAWATSTVLSLKTYKWVQKRMQLILKMAVVILFIS